MCFKDSHNTHQRRNIVNFGIWFTVFIYHNGRTMKCHFKSASCIVDTISSALKSASKLPFWPENMDSMLHVLHIIAYNLYRTLLHVTLMFQAAQIHVLTSNACARI